VAFVLIVVLCVASYSLSFHMCIIHHHVGVRRKVLKL